MKVGSLVECVNDQNWTHGNRATIYRPVKGKIYTVRGMVNWGDIGVYLEELVNPKVEFIHGWDECPFNVKRFREVLPPMEISIENILEKQYVERNQS